MPDDGDVFIRRDFWGSRFDKVWWLGGTLFYGLPCLVTFIAGAVQRHLVMTLVGGGLLAAFGTLNWMIRSTQHDRLLAEVSADGIRVREDRPMLPWSRVAWVGEEWVGAPGTTGRQRAMAFHLVDGGKVVHVFSGNRIAGIHDDVRTAIRRFAPQIPISHTDTPPEL